MVVYLGLGAEAPDALLFLPTLCGGLAGLSVLGLSPCVVTKLSSVVCPDIGVVFLVPLVVLGLAETSGLPLDVTPPSSWGLPLFCILFSGDNLSSEDTADLSLRRFLCSAAWDWNTGVATVLVVLMLR
jgi:hypothetical protein